MRFTINELEVGRLIRVLHTWNEASVKSDTAAKARLRGGTLEPGESAATVAMQGADTQIMVNLQTRLEKAKRRSRRG